MNTPDTTAWGETAAGFFLGTHPLIAELVRPGVPTDPARLIEAITTDETGISTTFAAICGVIESGIGQLQHNLNAAEGKIYGYQGRITELEATIQSNTAIIKHMDKLLLGRGQAEPTSILRRLTSDPPKFKGDEKEIAKRQQEYVNFRDQVNRCLTVDQETFNTPFRQIQFIAGLLDGDAYDMNRDKFRLVTEHPGDREYWYWKTTTDVWSTLNTQYETLDLSHEAAIKYDNLRMANKPFQNFIAEFNMLAAKCNKTAEQMVADMKLKVSGELSDATYSRQNQPGKSDVAKWQSWYQEIYNVLQEKAHVDKLRAGKGLSRANSQIENDHHQQPAPSQARQPAQQALLPTGDPMVLDATRTRTRPSREQCIREGLCFYCKKRGHNLDSCREKLENDAKYGDKQPALYQQRRHTPDQLVPFTTTRAPYQFAPTRQPTAYQQQSYFHPRSQTRPQRDGLGFRRDRQAREIDLGGHVEDESVFSESTDSKDFFPTPETGSQQGGSGKV